MKGRARKSVLTLFGIVIMFAIFNDCAQEITDINTTIRLMMTGRRIDARVFTVDGIPINRHPRMAREYVSPFYVVHYGLIYSEQCRESAGSDAYHWIADSTIDFWPDAPQSSSKAMFKATADWVIDNVTYVDTNMAHLLYEFDWRYPRYPSGKLRAPWWSGLTDGRAITLLLRAWDCFHDDRYLELAEDLYRSTVTPVEEGGSLVYMNGHPWVEEYVDPRVDAEEMSRVLNGMAYAYFGIAAYEDLVRDSKWQERLITSIHHNIGVYDKGYWSYYDAIGTSANIKYHGINLALLQDPRLTNRKFNDTIRRWEVGRMFPFVFYLLLGPLSISMVQFYVFYLASVGLFVVLGNKVWRRLGE